MKRIEDLVIAFSGPSGAGKTTLCKHLQKQGLNWVSTSAWDVLNAVEKDVLQRKFGYKQAGHRKVIQMGHANPEFAIAFQQMLRIARSRQIARGQEGLVIDRSPIDNLVYMYTQASMYMGEVAVEEFVMAAVQSVSNLDCIIFTPISSQQPYIEDNKSRINNLSYQSYVSGVFEWVINSFGHYMEIPYLRLDTWDLEYRKETVDNFLIDVANGKAGQV